MPRGPVPSRSEDLSRARDANRSGRVPITKGKAKPVVHIPEPDGEWHPVAKMLYEALQHSGQAEFYQESDWVFAWSLCDDLSYYKRSGRRSAQMLQAINSAMERLLVTEGDRRRVRIELEGEEPEDETSEAVMEEYRKALGLDA